MDRPKITTAIPQRRYQFGEYSVTVLGEIESTDPPNYTFILAMVKEGDSEPSVYVICDRRRRGDSAYRMRLVMAGFNETMGESDDWGDVDAFCEFALQVAAKALGLGDETPHLLT
jgi:hypothetical protein